MEILNLDGNNISKLSSNVFFGLVALNELYRSSNQINSIDPDVFQDLKNLKDLNLSSNNLSK